MKWLYSILLAQDVNVNHRIRTHTLQLVCRPPADASRFKTCDSMNFILFCAVKKRCIVSKFIIIGPYALCDGKTHFSEKVSISIQISNLNTPLNTDVSPTKQDL